LSYYCDSVIDDRGVATVMIIRMNKIGREVRGRPVGTRENPGGASKGVKPHKGKKLRDKTIDC
jgi:hypothetical protein